MRINIRNISGRQPLKVKKLYLIPNYNKLDLILI